MINRDFKYYETKEYKLCDIILKANKTEQTKAAAGGTPLTILNTVNLVEPSLVEWLQAASAIEKIENIDSMVNQTDIS